MLRKTALPPSEKHTRTYVPVRPKLRLPPKYPVSEYERRTDCRKYIGAWPCVERRPCQGCDLYEPVNQRILFTHLGFHGDMLITSPLAKRLKDDNPHAHITWLVDEKYAAIVQMNPYVDRVLFYNWENMSTLESEMFDLVVGMERHAPAAALVHRISAARKVGLAHGGPDNALYALDPVGEGILMMDTWNDFRTHANATTWTERYFKLCGFEYDKEPYVAEVPEAERHAVRDWLDPDDRPLVLLNLGGSLATKIWPDDGWRLLSAALIDDGCRIVFAGGPDVADRCTALVDYLIARGADANAAMYRATTVGEMCALPEFVDLVVTGDSFGFHASLLHERRTVLLLGPSSPNEVVPKHATWVDMIRSTFPCSPCAYHIACEGIGGCMDVIAATDVIAHARAALLTSSGMTDAIS